MDLQVEAIVLLLKEKQVNASIGEYLFNGADDLYTVDEILEKFPKTNTRQSDSTYRGEIVQLLQKLQSYGAGTFTIGRREQKTRFQFAPGIKTVIRPKLVRFDRSELRHAWTADKVKVDTSQDRTSGYESSDMVSHAFVLRRGCKVEFSLPEDLTEQEAERLAHFLKTLPLK